MTGRYYGFSHMGFGLGTGFSPLHNYTYWAKKEFKTLKPWCRDETAKKIKEIEGRTKNLRRLDKEAVEEIRQLLIDESEWAFEEAVIKKFPYVVVCPVPPPDEIWSRQQPSLEYIDRQIAWLKERHGPTTYIAFPTSASGKHKECARNVYFKKANDALMFKLSCI